MKYTASIIILIIIIIGGAFFFFNRAEAPSDTGGLDTNQNGASGTFLEGEAPENFNDTEGLEPEFDESPSSQGDTGTQTSSASDAVTVVTYTDDGFSPETVTITQGDTVRFVNESGGRMWVGSDIHPTHSLYSEKTTNDCLGSAFDQCGVNNNGESWEFTFTQAGEWGYHNHVRASKRGTVVVE